MIKVFRVKKEGLNQANKTSLKPWNKFPNCPNLTKTFLRALSSTEISFFRGISREIFNLKEREFKGLVHAGKRRKGKNSENEQMVIVIDQTQIFIFIWYHSSAIRPFTFGPICPFSAVVLVVTNAHPTSTKSHYKKNKGFFSRV